MSKVVETVGIYKTLEIRIKYLEKAYQNLYPNQPYISSLTLKQELELDELNQ